MTAITVMAAYHIPSIKNLVVIKACIVTITMLGKSPPCEIKSQLIIEEPFTCIVYNSWPTVYNFVRKVVVKCIVKRAFLGIFSSRWSLFAHYVTY